MTREQLDEIKKELETLIEFREGTGKLKDSFFGKHQGKSINLTYDGDSSRIWIGKMDDKYKINLSMSLVDCTVKIEDSKIRFHGRDFIITIGG